VAAASAGAWLAALVLALPVLAAEPTPSPLAGDPRSAGEGPGLVGEPLFAIAVVLGIALVAIVATTVWVRATGGRSSGGTSAGGTPR
jgi:hypothetical protein